MESQNTGGLRRAKGAKKGALDVFSKLLAGLSDQKSMRKAKADGEDVGETAAEGLAGADKLARAANSAVKKAKLSGEDAKAPSGGGEKIQNRERRLLSALRGVPAEEGESLSPRARLKDAAAGKMQARQAEEAGEVAEDALNVGQFLAQGGTQALLNGEEPLAAGLDASDAADSGGAFGADGAESRLRGLKAAGGLAQDSDGASRLANAEGALRQGQEKGRIAGAEKKDKPAAVETRNSKKNKEKVSLEVRDLRTGQDGVAVGGAQEPNPRAEAGTERVADIMVELKNSARSWEFSQPGQEKSAGQAFEDILARELHQNLNGDIVRQASIMVKDGGEGTIRLSLKPESLGMVKIRLEMAENKITGHIIVESDEALRAFEKEIRSLEQAFRDSGFAGASLDMALAGDAGQNGAQGQWNREAAAPLFASRLVSSNYDAMAETMDAEALEPEFDGFESPGMARVNVLV